MPLEGAKAGVQIGATHSLSEPGTFALGFSLNIITWVSTTVSSEQPRAIQEAWERTWTGFSRSTWPFLLFKTTLNEPAGETGPACPGAAAQRCPGAGCWVSADTLVFLLSCNPTGVVCVSAQLCHKFLRASLTDGPGGKSGADCDIQERWYWISSWGDVNSFGVINCLSRAPRQLRDVCSKLDMLEQHMDFCCLFMSW